MFWKAKSIVTRMEPAVSAGSPESIPSKSLQRLIGRALQLQSSPRLLMLGELCGQNIAYLGERGFRVSVEKDIKAGMEDLFAAAILWDALWMMPPEVARRRTQRLFDMLEPGAPVLAFFGAPAPPAPCPRSRYRILSDSTIRREAVEGRFGRAYPFQNRDILQIFERFENDHLQTKRDGRREALFFKPLSGFEPASGHTAGAA
ncbi:MAG TPA: hypothetical protein VNI57_04795 [Candidatus Saccharimonadales bacterium]|nr:hypothetical protein [Candidatus Saccharimonadales bacterium]